jgi:hypothetical protein
MTGLAETIGEASLLVLGNGDRFIGTLTVF